MDELGSIPRWSRRRQGVDFDLDPAVVDERFEDHAVASTGPQIDLRELLELLVCDWLLSTRTGIWQQEQQHDVT